MPEQLFVFIQFEFPWALGPADGRYLLRRASDGEPERVVVVETLVGGHAAHGHRRRAERRLAVRAPPGASREARARRRSRTGRPPRSPPRA